jgi:hypothetical protein
MRFVPSESGSQKPASLGLQAEKLSVRAFGRREQQIFAPELKMP